MWCGEFDWVLFGFGLVVGGERKGRWFVGVSYL